MSNNKKYFIIEEQRYSHVPTRFDIKYEKMFDYENAITKMFHLNALNEDKENKIYSVVGGGDTVSLINSLNSVKDFNFVSTAGGAFLEYLEGKELPGITALN